MFSFAFDNWASLLAVAESVSLLRDGRSADECMLPFGPFIGLRSQFWLSPASRTTLRAAGCSDGHTLVITCDGCSGFGQGCDINDGYFVPPNEGPGDGENAALANLAIGTIGNLRDMNFPDNGQMFICGYSAGGAVAIFLAKTLKALRPGNDVRCVMINPPRPAVREYATRTAQVYSLRYHTWDDPVQVLPLHTDESAYAAANIAFWRQERANRYTHVGWGVSLDDNVVARGVAIGEPANVPNIPSVSLAGWATGIMWNPVVNHSIEKAVTLLTAAVRLDVPFPRPWSAFNEPLPDSANPFTAMRATVDAGGPRTHGRNDGGPPPGSPSVMPFVPLGLPLVTSDADVKPFYPLKVAGSWWVYCASQECFKCRTKSEAKRRASNLNSVTRSLGNSEAADLEMVTEGLGYFSGLESPTRIF